MGLTAVTIVESSGVRAQILSTGYLLLTISFDDSGDLTPILAEIILDEAGDPILDVKGQYIIGGNG